MKHDRKTSSTEVQRRIAKTRELYESIGMTIDFETAVDLSQYLGKALDMARQAGSKQQKKRYVM